MPHPVLPFSSYGIDDKDIVSYEHAKAKALKSSPSTKTFSVQVVALRTQHHVLIKDRPVRIVDLTVSRCACKNRGKMHIVGIDIFTRKKLEDVTPVKASISAPILVSAEYTLLNIDGPILNLLTKGDELKDDVNVPGGDLGASLMAAFREGKELRVKTLSALAEEHVVAYEEVGD
ncbi:eukaryotic translation initiation factor 5A [Mycena pura]|uniref:Eukaryotic translation initiation factor 5A n=1 Tax=Mycena pura TaxID=153505 RepID=A0AAD6V2S3_9AGAR|nr:eukaryotic translation initiation factor 5A [Mycena pura]